MFLEYSDLIFLNLTSLFRFFFRRNPDFIKFRLDYKNMDFFNINIPIKYTFENIYIVHWWTVFNNSLYCIIVSCIIKAYAIVLSGKFSFKSNSRRTTTANDFSVSSCLQQSSITGYFVMKFSGVKSGVVCDSGSRNFENTSYNMVKWYFPISWFTLLYG